MPSLRKANPHASAYIGSLSFGVDEKEPALQAADLLAGVSKDYFVRRVQGSEAKDDLSCLSAKLGRQVGIGYVDEAVFEKLAAGNILKNGRPSIYSSVQEKLFRDLFKIENL